MPVKAFLDTNVLIYAVSKDDSRTAVAEELLASGGVLGVQILNEFVSAARRQMLISSSDVNEALDAFVTLCPSPLPITMETHGRGRRIVKKYEYNIYDALVVSAALETGCTILYPEGLQGSQTIEGQLSIRNPFGGLRGWRIRIFKSNS